MIVYRRMRPGALLLFVWKASLIMIGFSAVIVFLHKRWIDLSMPLSIPLILATAISILLGFRTNSAYERWWEARQIWGAIVNDSRTLARQVLSFMTLPDGAQGNDADLRALQEKMVHRQIAWNYALCRSLREQDPLTEIERILPQENHDALRAQSNRPNALLVQQTESLAYARKNQLVDGFAFLAIEDTLKRFSDHMGMCERIKKTVFPTPFDYLLGRSIGIFFFLLPSGLVSSLGWFTVPVAYFVGLVFRMSQGIGQLLQDPFENRSTDTPMTAICTTIEINLREQLGEAEVPKSPTPVDGILM